MHLEWARPGILRATAHPLEFAALVAAARFVAESAPSDIPAESLEQLRHVLRDYDAQARRLHDTPAPDGP
ncbi:hypothetical protein ACFWFZ_26315 [Streptomyces sp. NPDC060232]|uniref:hypothetical protein n=1 Tax=Streptomyces sp. NPDC060232 TaxID=3347079 RepID=UPI00364DB197